jgi:hypothetical protein
MSPEQALQIVQQALDVATKNGVYSLSDANNIILALNSLNKLVTDNLPDLSEMVSDSHQ